MGETGSHGTTDWFIPGGFEWGSEDGDEGNFWVKNETGDAYPCETFDTAEVKVSAGPLSDVDSTYVKKTKRENSA